MLLKPCGGVRVHRACVLREGKQHSVLQRPVERDLLKVPGTLNFTDMFALHGMPVPKEICRAGAANVDLCGVSRARGVRWFLEWLDSPSDDLMSRTNEPVPLTFVVGEGAVVGADEKRACVPASGGWEAAASCWKADALRSLGDRDRSSMVAFPALSGWFCAPAAADNRIQKRVLVRF